MEDVATTGTGLTSFLWIFIALFGAFAIATVFAWIKSNRLPKV